MSREDWEVFDEIRQERKDKRAKRLASTDTTGWTKLTMYHFRLQLARDRVIDWWPSANKWLLRSTVKVNGKKFEKYYRGSIPKDLRDEISLQLNPLQEL